MYDADGNRTYDHYTDHENIYEWAFNTFSYEKILSVTDEITEVPVKLGDGAEHVILVPSEDFYTLWPNTLDSSSLKKEIVTRATSILTNPLPHPLKKAVYSENIPFPFRARLSVPWISWQKTTWRFHSLNTIS